MKTGTIQNKLLGSARKELSKAAGRDNVISKADEKALPKDLQTFRRQIEDLVKKLGGPGGLEVAVVKQKVEVHGISDTDSFPAQVWTIRDPETNDAVSIAVRKGSL